MGTNLELIALFAQLGKTRLFIKGVIKVNKLLSLSAIKNKLHTSCFEASVFFCNSTFPCGYYTCRKAVEVYLCRLGELCCGTISFLNAVSLKPEQIRLCQKINRLTRSGKIYFVRV